MSYNSFLPEDFESVTTKKPYINLGKLPEGEYKFRLVTRPIAGWIDWKDKKPMRFRPKNKPAASVDATKPMKPFWAMYVWDYKQQGLYVMEVTQNSIRCALEDLAKSEDWGDLTAFDFKIKKTGAGIETNYSVIPVPHKPLEQVIKDCLAISPVRLEALYEGKDPWTDLEASEPTISDFRGISEAQEKQLHALLQKINDHSVQKELETNFKVASIYNIPEQEFTRAMTALENHVKNKQEKAHDKRRMASVA
jgi:hypothetical protein